MGTECMHNQSSYHTLKKALVYIFLHFIIATKGHQKISTLTTATYGIKYSRVD